jgi:hypothetical protein
MPKPVTSAGQALIGLLDALETAYKNKDGKIAIGESWLKRKADEYFGGERLQTDAFTTMKKANWDNWLGDTLIEDGDFKKMRENADEYAKKLFRY